MYLFSIQGISPSLTVFSHTNGEIQAVREAYNVVVFCHFQKETWRSGFCEEAFLYKKINKNGVYMWITEDAPVDACS